MDHGLEEETVKKAGKNANVLDYPGMVDKLARDQKIPGAKVRQLVRALTAAVAEGLKAGKIVRIPGLGSLEVRNLPVKEGQPERHEKRIVLLAAKTLKVSVNI